MDKKVLVATPTGELKDYCFERWIERVKNLTYPNYDIHIVDNSENREYMRNIKNSHGEHLTIERVSPNQYKSFRHALARSHDKCREKALKNGYDYLLHLESDVFPPLDVIEDLISANKRVVGALYHIELGEQSKLMIQGIEGFGMAHRETFNLDESDLSFVDGTVKPVFSCGLGCVLIHRSVLEKVPFRFEGDGSVHPDSIYYGDLNQQGIRVWAHTGIYCEHENKSMVRV